jgi:glycosyltransferase involved in cell wall biosynthesis
MYLGSLKVALISEEFPPFMFGGISSFCYDLAYNLSKRSIPTTVFCGRSRKTTIEQLNKYLTVVRLPCFDFPPRFFWFQLQNSDKVLKLLREYTIVHIVNPQAGAFFTFFKRKLGKPFVTSIHGVPFYDLRTFFKSPISYWTAGDFGCNFIEYPLNDFSTRTCLSNSDQIITCSYTTLSEIKRTYPDIIHNKKMSVIYNGINFDKVDNTNVQSKSLNEKNFSSLIYFGRLFWRKGLIYLIKAFAIIKKQYPNASLHIFGKGPLEQKMKKEVSNLGLKKNVYIRGYIPYAELLKEIKNADVVVLPSLYEAQPIAALEAMAYKKPVVAFDFAFAREYIQNFRTGLLAKACDIQDLSDKIILLLNDEKLRFTIGQNAFKHIKRNHDWNVLAKKYIKIYEKVADLN